MATKVASYLKKDPRLLHQAAEDVLDTMIDEIILGVCFDIHRSAKIGALEVILGDAAPEPSIPIAGHIDLFGHQVTTITGLPSLKNVPQIECPNCQRQLAASRFAPHLEKCMGMGRNSSRLASRRLATSNKESYREGGQEDEEGDDDEDWIEPGKINSNRRKRDKNSPKRTKPVSLRFRGGEGGSVDGLVTPPQSYDQLSLDERRHLLNNICGVAGNNGRICTRSSRCPAHSDPQRREVRLKWLGSGSQQQDDDSHVDIDSFSEGDTAALRESLSQLSNVSSPAESTISTCSNPSSRGRRDKGRRIKKSRAGSKNGSSRGSTPPLME